MVKTVYIVLFRGVGGATQLPTAPLRAALGDAGFGEVATYINSGNAIVSTSLAREKCHALIARITKEKFGFGKDIFLRTVGEWSDAVASNPFPEAQAAPTTVHLFALQAEPEKAAVEALRARLGKSERIVVDGEHMYLHTPEGLGRSKTPPLIDRLLGMPTTARNWNTALRLLRMAQDVS